MKAKSTFLAQNALPSPTLVPGSPHDDGSGLPTAASGGNISPERPVIRWMSVHFPLAAAPLAEEKLQRREAGPPAASEVPFIPVTGRSSSVGNRGGPPAIQMPVRKHSQTCSP
jgi:hypothetical protein